MGGRGGQWQVHAEGTVADAPAPSSDPDELLLVLAPAGIITSWNT